MITRLLGVLAVISFLMAPILSDQITRTCTCTSADCHSSKGMSCCGGNQYSTCFSQGCHYPNLVSTTGSMDVYDPGYSYFGESSLRTYNKQGPPTSSSSGSVSRGRYSTPTPDNSNDGPPDLDVVKYLPSSARHVFDVLTTNSPLTQKDLISKTDLPPRTIRYALSRLKSEDILEEQFCFQDARQSLYSLNGIGQSRT